jgi:Tfp pilus assembly protein PilV
MIVATVVLAIGVVGATTAFNSATKVSSAASDIQLAALLAQQQINQTEVNGQGTISPGDSDGDFGSDYPGFKYHQSVTSTDYTYLLQVTVTVKWGANPERQRSVTTYLVNTQSNTSTSTSTSTTGGTGG